MNLSVVIPAYNESGNIQKVIEELISVFKAIPSINSFEIIVCDDHSTDNTYEVVKSINQTNIKAIRLSRRSGSHTAIRAGLRKAKGDAVLCISADGQDNPSVLQEMIKKIQQGSHTIWAVRKRREEPFLQKYSAKLFYSIFKYLFEYNHPDNVDLSNADFFLIQRKVVDSINACNERNTALFGLLMWMGFKHDYVLYERRERMSGKSKWNFKSKWQIMKDSFMAFSLFPIKLITYLGIFTLLIGLLNAGFFIFYYYKGYQTPSWSLGFITTLITGGIILISIGIIGEYLWRTFDESRKRPLFFIEDQTD